MHKFFLALLLVVSFALPAQSDSLAVSFIAYWSVGDVYKFSVSKLKENYVDGALTTTDTTAYLSTLEVIDSTADGYRLRYSWVDDEFNLVKLPEGMLPKIKKYSHLTAFEYTTDAVGAFRQLENWEDYANMMQEFFDVLILEAGKAGRADTTALRRALEPQMSVYRTETGIGERLLSEIMQMHALFGYAFRTVDTLRYTEEMPTLFGNRTMEMDRMLYVQAFAPQDDYVEIRQLGELTPASREEMVQLMIGVMPGVTDTEEAQAQLSRMDINLVDDNWSAYYYWPGIPIAMDNERTVTIRDGETERVHYQQLTVEWVE